MGQTNWSTSVLLGFGISQKLKAEAADAIKRNLAHLYEEETYGTEYTGQNGDTIELTHPGDYAFDEEIKKQRDQPFAKHTIELVPLDNSARDWHESY